MADVRGVSFVLTSCNRFDLLEETLISFFKHNTYPIEEYIIIEDSHNIDKLTEVLAKFPDIDFTVLHNQPQVGQMKSVERAYSHVKTDYIFHCEDDWEFYRDGFIEDSFKVLDSDDKIVTIWLREQNDTNKHPIEPTLFECKEEGRPYQIMMRNYGKHNNTELWHGFTFNPGLRRTKDYTLVAPIGDLDGENAMSTVYHEHGFKAAIFETGYVRHIGYHRGIRYNITQSEFLKDLSVKYRKVKALVRNTLKI